MIVNNDYYACKPDNVEATRERKLQEGWCDSCNPDNCVGCGPVSHNHAYPEINEENSHE